MKKHGSPDEKTLITDHWLDFLEVRGGKSPAEHPPSPAQWQDQLLRAERRIDTCLADRREIHPLVPDPGFRSGAPVGSVLVPREISSLDDGSRERHHPDRDDVPGLRLGRTPFRRTQ